MNIDEQISQTKIEYIQAKKRSHHIYIKALEFQDKIMTGKISKTDKNLDIFDRALLVIKKWNRENTIYVDW